LLVSPARDDPHPFFQLQMLSGTIFRPQNSPNRSKETNSSRKKAQTAPDNNAETLMQSNHRSRRQREV